MSSLAIRRLNPAVKERLRLRAARRGHSMEEEVRCILADACEGPTEPATLGALARELFGPENGVELDLPPRQTGREPPSIE